MQVTQGQLGEALGLTTRRIRQLNQERGVFQAEPNRKYDLTRCVAEFVELRVDAATKRAERLDKEQVAAAHEQVKMEISTLKLKKLQRLLVSTHDVERVVTDMLTAFRSMLLALPARTAPQVIGVLDPVEVAGILDREVLLALEQLHSYDPAGDDSDDDDEEDLDDGA